MMEESMNKSIDKLTAESATGSATGSATKSAAGSIESAKATAGRHEGRHVVIVGAGLAGLSVALSLVASDTRCRVTLLAKQEPMLGASDRAQGGIAAVLDSSDSVDEHVQDTLIAGAGLCDEAAVRGIVEAGEGAIRWLIDQGAEFTPDADMAFGYHLTREGGHSHRRIIHAADATGHAVLSALHARVPGHPRIRVLAHHQAVELIVESGNATARRCIGVQVLDSVAGTVSPLLGDDIVLATGGAGQIYPYTSNPGTATGDGIAMAARAGCRIANLEFIQFHPTCLYENRVDSARSGLAETETAQASGSRDWSFLISEAVRGEGGILKRPNDGYRFMPDLDPRAELAPRDIVARAITREMLTHGLDYVHLDISHQPAAFLETHFPTIFAHCLARGIDMRTQPIPVVPAAHYTCGGIVTDLAGRTDLPGLYAVGEAGCTGLHGANRLASNSLLECVVIGRAAANAICAQGSGALRPGNTTTEDAEAADAVRGGASAIPDLADVSDVSSTPHAPGTSTEALASDLSAAGNIRAALRRLMWEAAGIQREGVRLAAARKQIAAWRDAYAAFGTTADAAAMLAIHGQAGVPLAAARIDLRNLLQIGELIVAGASSRDESRGAHYRFDAPGAWPKGLPTVLAQTPAGAPQ